MLSMSEMRAKLLEQKQNLNSNSDRSNSKFFQFSKMTEGSSVRIRFVEDADANNQYFWRTRANRTLKFSGLISKGKFYDGEIYVDVPAFNLKTGEIDNTLPEDRAFTSTDDPIQQKIKNLWNEGTEGQELYRKFRRKTAYVYRGFVREEGAESRMQYFIMSNQIQPKIEKAISDPEQAEAFPNLPVDVQNGRDFILRCDLKDGRRNYELSDWSLKTSALTPDELTILSNDMEPLYNLLPKKPDVNQIEIMNQMYDAVTSDQPFDFDNWGKAFKPNNVYIDSDGNIQVKNGNNVSMNDDDKEVTPVSTKTKNVEAIVSSISQPPAQVTTEEVNNAIKTNTQTIDASNAQSLIANLMAQFQNQQE